jgi:hypothetical protein
MGRGAPKDVSKNPLGPLCFAGVCNEKIVFYTFGFFELIVSTVFFFPLS